MSRISNFQNSKHARVIDKNLASFERNPIGYYMALKLYEYDLLYYYAGLIGGIGLTFKSSIQFSKPTYQKGEEVLFTNTAFEMGDYESFKYDSVSFYLNKKKQEVDYSLEQVVNTAIVKFRPKESGVFYIELHTTLDSHLQKSISNKVSTFIEIK